MFNVVVGMATVVSVVVTCLVVVVSAIAVVVVVAVLVIEMVVETGVEAIGTFMVDVVVVGPMQILQPLRSTE
jgi:hypothetical protein